MVITHPRLWPRTDCTTNYRPVLSSESVLHDEEQSNFPAKERKTKIWSWAPKGRPTPRHTDWPTFSRKVTPTSNGTSWRWVISYTLCSFTLRENPGTHWIRGWVGPRAVLDYTDTYFQSRRRPVRSHAIPTELPRFYLSEWLQIYGTISCKDRKRDV
jgi:hypothetical protein